MNLLLSLQLTIPEQFTKHGQKYKSFEDFLMIEVMLNLIYKRNKAIPKTACSSLVATRLELNRTA